MSAHKPMLTKSWPLTTMAFCVSMTPSWQNPFTSSFFFRVDADYWQTSLWIRCPVASNILKLGLTVRTTRPDRIFLQRLTSAGNLAPWAIRRRCVDWLAFPLRPCFRLSDVWRDCSISPQPTPVRMRTAIFENLVKVGLSSQILLGLRLASISFSNSEGASTSSSSSSLNHLLIEFWNGSQNMCPTCQRTANGTYRIRHLIKPNLKKTSKPVALA